jgi:hypothetical protein
MVQTLTAAQQAALDQAAQQPVIAVKVDLGTDLLYCTGVKQVTLDSTVYMPRGLEVSAINISDPTSSSATVKIDDLDGTVGTSWYTNRFTGATVTITEAIWYGGAWEKVRTIPWLCVGVERSSDGIVTLKLSGAGGMKPRAGLERASRASFHLAPEPGKSIRVGYTSTVIG